ncbi:MAG: fibronectin type III domain-containing protein [Bacteroidales bacterium]|nr:fibronectin type III domain-containing protein [Bacteroidales bacterium]
MNYNNIFINPAPFELWNGNPQTEADLDAKHNWWGTTNTSHIDSVIYDYFDDQTKSLVDYSLYLTTPDTTAPVSPPFNVQVSNIGGNQLQLTWNANPEGDLKGYRIYWGGFTGYSFTNSINVGNVLTYTLTGVSIADTIGVTAFDNLYGPANEDPTTITNDNMTIGHESWYAYASINCMTSPVGNAATVWTQILLALY